MSKSVAGMVKIIAERHEIRETARSERQLATKDAVEEKPQADTAKTIADATSDDSAGGSGTAVASVSISVVTAEAHDGAVTTSEDRGEKSFVF